MSINELNEIILKSSMVLEDVILQVVNVNGQVVAQSMAQVKLNGQVEHEMMSTSNITPGMHFITLTCSHAKGSLPIVLN